MQSKFSRWLTLTILTTLISLSLLLGFFSRVEASEDDLSSESKGDNPLGIVIERQDEPTIAESTKKSDQKLSMKDIFGDDQVFPFQP